MKKIVFLTIATLLVLGLVLTGCNGNGVENVIKIAVVGPMTDLQGQNHWDGATLAMEEINDAGGVTVGGVDYTVELVAVETKEATEGELGDTGSANLLAVIDDMAFCVGGFRTEAVQVYREVAMEAEKVFINCGAATDSLQFSVVTNYDKYKYWFKGTPYNSTFLVKSLLKMASTIGGGVLAATLVGYNAAVKADYQIGSPQTVPLRVVILMENAAWCTGIVGAAQYYLPAMGFNVTNTILVDPTAATIGPGNWATIIADKPHIIFTAFSGSVGAVYSSERVTNGVPAVTIGINVPGQQLLHWVNTDGDCEGEILLDTWAVGLNQTPETGAWVDAFVARFGRYPVYTAGTYDSIKQGCRAIEDTQSFDSDVIVAWLEDPDNAMDDSVGTPKIQYYPMPADTLETGVTYALNESQVLALYPNIGSAWMRFSPALPPPYWEAAMGYTQSDWLVGESSKPHIAHDTVYGPGYMTGIGSQWQKEGGVGAGQKVGIWPVYLGEDPVTKFKLTDQYGYWNFQYPGTEKYILTIGGMLNIAWDPYA